MKKNLMIIACVCMLAVALSACSKAEETTETSVAPETSVETVAEAQENLEPVIQPREDVAESVAEETAPLVADEYSEYDPGLAGSWHDAIAGRAYMTVTAVENDGFAFDVTWPDSAFGYYTWTFTAYPNEAGVYYYSNGHHTYQEADENGNITETLITDEAHGNVAVLLDGSMEWVEDGDEPETHSFVMD